jgi:hypothetical protein
MDPNPKNIFRVRNTACDHCSFMPLELCRIWMTRNYEPKLIRVSRNYDVEVYENHEITHFHVIPTKNNVFNENIVNLIRFTNMD